MAHEGNSPRMTREHSLAILYAPAMAFERLSMTLDGILQETEETELDETSTRPQSNTVSRHFEIAARLSSHFESSPVIRDFALGQSPSVRRKPVPNSLANAKHSTARNGAIPEIESSTVTSLQQAGSAAQAKRKKRRVSSAFSEILANLSDRREENEAESTDGGVHEQEQPRRIKRLKTRIASWFDMTKKSS